MAPVIAKMIYNMEIFKFILYICVTVFGLVVRSVAINLHFLLDLSVKIFIARFPVIPR
jgi:hypothetical protein